jgi:hypothetical protein
MMCLEPSRWLGSLKGESLRVSGILNSPSPHLTIGNEILQDSTGAVLRHDDAWLGDGARVSSCTRSI